MKKVLETIIFNIVDNKDAVVIIEELKDNAVSFKIKVDPTEIGKIIGKQGKNAKAIRTLMKAAGSKEGKKVLLEIVD
ncbi:MAG: KH domain-containing protein [Clostridia bacterium]|nr:KH domain-containing protein [Clostridia bacterium]